MRVSNVVSRDLGEFLVYGDSPVSCAPEEVSLETRLGNIHLQYPFLTARMQSVVGPELAVAAGREGILTCVPRSLPDEDKQAILDANNQARLKKGDVALHSTFDYASDDATFGAVKAMIKRTGHSIIPVLDRFSKVAGFYIHDPAHPPALSDNDPVTKALTPLASPTNEGIPFARSEKEAKKLLEEGERFVPLIDEKGVLQQLAFKQKYDTNAIALAISSRGGWEEEIEKWGPQVDALMIDSSNAHFVDAYKILEAAKKHFPNTPFGIGNIITGKAFKNFAEVGADFIIAGMGAGSICQTGHKRNNGRGQFTVMQELAEARDERVQRDGKKYVPLVLDGGISTVQHMTVALAGADLVMCGGYFNKFGEAAGPTFDSEGNQTTDLDKAVTIETWGEGSERARIISQQGMGILFGKPPLSQDIESGQRYGHKTLGGATIEGVVGRIPVVGRLKPGVEDDANYLRTTIANVGARDLREYRQNAILELASDQVREKMAPHDLEVTGT